MTFARTKIRPPHPRPGSLIERPRLERRLTQALTSRRLVLVCAAAGFGKTMALAVQSERLPAGTALAWISCDEGDSLGQVVECLIEAPDPCDPPWRIAPDALVRSALEATTPPQLRGLAAELINALDACEVSHGVIVFDDFDRVEDALAPKFIDLLLARFSPRWTLAIAGRRRPPLALGRLRAQGELVEFGAEDLRFEGEEVQRLGAQAGWAPQAVERLSERAQGWPAGLGLALAGSGHVASGPAGWAVIDRAVFDYLAAEVIDQLDPALRDFLLRCSMLPELSAARCAAVSGDALASWRLEQIEQSGLFVTVQQDHEPTLRLHDLFREALQARFEREHPAQFAQALVAAAATESDPLRRVGWLQRAQAWDSAQATFIEQADELIAGGAANAVRALFERFPSQHRASPRMQMLLARTRWDWDAAVKVTGQAAAAFAQAGDETARLDALSLHCAALSGANHPRRTLALSKLLIAEPRIGVDALARTLCSAAWMELARGDPRRIAPMWEHLLGTLEAGASLARWAECVPLPTYIGQPGMRPLLQRYLRGARARLPEHPTPLRGMCQVLEGWLHLWLGDVERAEACAEQAASDNKWLAQPAGLDAPSRSLRAVLLALRGEGSASLGIFQALIDQVRKSRVALRSEVYLGLYIYLAMRCDAMVGDTSALRTLAAKLTAEPADGRGWLSPLKRAAAGAHLAEGTGDLDAACRRWQEMLDHEAQSDLYGQAADTRLRLADSLCRRGHPTGVAAAVLEPLLNGLQAGDEWGAVLLSGPHILARLAAVDWSDTLAPAQQTLLARWSATASALGSREGHAQLTAAARPGPLSARELDVLRCIAAGDSNKLIARSLDISPHTVKRHVANILDKLGIASRGQAAAWYHEKT